MQWRYLCATWSTTSSGVKRCIVLGRKFAEYHGLDMAAEIARLQGEFAMEQAA